MPRNEIIVRCAVVLVFGLGVIATTGQVLYGIENQGNWDWDYYFFQGFSINRSLFEFKELPFWNPWYMGGVPSIGNFQSFFPSPWILLDIVAGPIASIKLKIVAHQIIGLAAMYWMARGFRMSRLAAVYVSGTFFFSSWLALRVHSGHLTYISSAFLPLLVGLFARARNQHKFISSLGSGAILALMILQGGIYDVIFTSFIIGPLTLIWCLQDRSARPLLYALIVGALTLGFSAIKLFPVFGYMQENPRATEPGGTSWKRVLEDQNHVEDEDPAKKTSLDTAANPETAKAKPKRPISKWELPKFALRIFLSRDQRSNTIYSPLQSYGWHEYGAYIGPLAIILMMMGPFFAFKQTWPWILIAMFCFITAAGNFTTYAPWTLIHKLPVFKSMHCPSRLLIPCIFAVSIAAGFALDALRTKLAGPHLQRRDVVLGLLVAAALLDSVFVSHHSIMGTFPKPPPPVGQPRTRHLVTVNGDYTNMTMSMFDNQCNADGYEPIGPDVWVQTVDSPDYHGETYFHPDAANTPMGKVELVAWTPNSVTVRASCPTAGSIILNRNWYKGWRANAPYTVTPLDGLISSRVEPGEHVIHFVFVPSDFWVGSCVSLTTFALAGLSLFHYIKSQSEVDQRKFSASRGIESH